MNRVQGTTTARQTANSITENKSSNTRVPALIDSNKYLEDLLAQADALLTDFAVHEIKRMLRATDVQLKKSKGQKNILELGEYYLIDQGLNCLIETDVNVRVLYEELRLGKRPDLMPLESLGS